LAFAVDLFVPIGVLGIATHCFPDITARWGAVLLVAAT